MGANGIELTDADRAATGAELGDVSDDELRKAIATLQGAGAERVAGLAKGFPPADEEEDETPDPEEDDETPDPDDDDDDAKDAKAKGGDKASAKEVLKEMGLPTGGKDDKEEAAPARKSFTDHMDDDLVEVLETEEVIADMFKSFEATRSDDYAALEAKFDRRLKRIEGILTNMTKSLQAGETPQPLRAGNTKPLEKSLGNPAGGPTSGPTKAEVEAVTSAAMQKSLITGQEGITIDMAVGTPNWAAYAGKYEQLRQQLNPGR